MRKFREWTTEELVALDIERKEAATSRKAYQAALARDPDFRAVAGQALPDRFYATARAIERQHGRDAALAFLQREIIKADAKSEADLRAHLAANPSGNPHRMSRADATLSTAFKVTAPSVVACALLYPVTPPEWYVYTLGFAGFYNAARLLAAALTGEVW